MVSGFTHTAILDAVAKEEHTIHTSFHMYTNVCTCDRSLRLESLGMATASAYAKKLLSVITAVEVAETSLLQWIRPRRRLSNMLGFTG